MSENKINGFPTKIFIGLLLLIGMGNYFLLNIQGLFYVGVSEHFGVTRSAFSLYYTVQCAGAFIGAAFAGNIIAKFKKQMPLLILGAAIVQFLCYFLFSRAQSVAVFFVVAPFLGIAGAFDTHAVMGLVLANWFNKKNGLILGVVTAFSSLFGALVAPSLTVLANADWRAGYFTVGCCILIFIGLSSLFLRFSPELYNRKAWGADEVEASATAQPVLSTAGVSHATALKSPTFYYCFLVLFFALSWSCFYFAVPGYIASVGFDATVIGLCASAYSIGGLFGKLAVGWLNDRLGYMKTITISATLGILGMLLLIFCGNLPVFAPIVGTIFFGIANANANIFPPILTKTCFGNKDYAKIYSNIQMATWLASMIMIPIYNAFYDFVGSYVPGMFLVIVIEIMAIVCSALAMRSAKKLTWEE